MSLAGLHGQVERLGQNNLRITNELNDVLSILGIEQPQVSVAGPTTEVYGTIPMTIDYCDRIAGEQEVVFDLIRIIREALAGPQSIDKVNPHAAQYVEKTGMEHWADMERNSGFDPQDGRLRR